MNPRFRLETTAVTDTGRERPRNDDSYLVRQKSPAVLGVCDGMGGHAGGNVASRIAVEVIAANLEGVRADAAESFETRLRRAIVVASRSILACASAQPELRGMGTTATIAVLEGSDLVIAQVGDSRAYLFRDGELAQLTRDQTLARALFEQGQLSAEELESSNYAHVILEAVGVKELPQVEISRTELRAGDLLLICSDGLFGPVGDAILREIVSAGGSLNDIARTLVDEANRRGGPDNITCVLGRVIVDERANESAEDTFPELPLRPFWRWT
jgi:serine/threonine protein phosphatase PrpC